MRRALASSAPIETGDRAAWKTMRDAAVRRAPPLLLGKILYLEKLTVRWRDPTGAVHRAKPVA